MASRPERALILLKPQFLGDAVMACPMIDAIATHYDLPVVMCGPVVTEMLSCRKGSVRFEMGEKIAGILPILRSARRIRKLGIEHALVVNRSFRSAMAVRLAGVKVRVGHATEGRGFLLTHKVPYDEIRFEAECYLDLAKAIDVAPGTARPALLVQPAEKSKSQELLQGATVGIQPGARYRDKQVPLEVMAEVGREFAALSPKLALLGGSDEIDASRQFETMLSGQTTNLVGKLSIRESMRALRGLKLMVGSDTGLMHVAAAVGTPTVTVFGPNPASKWGHNYDPHRVIEAPNGDVSQVTARQIMAEVTTLRLT